MFALAKFLILKLCPMLQLLTTFQLTRERRAVPLRQQRLAAFAFNNQDFYYRGYLESSSKCPE